MKIANLRITGVHSRRVDSAISTTFTAQGDVLGDARVQGAIFVDAVTVTVTLPYDSRFEKQVGDQLILSTRFEKGESN